MALIRGVLLALAALLIAAFYLALGSELLRNWRASRRGLRAVKLTVCRVCCDTFVPHATDATDATLDDDLKNVCHVCRGEVTQICVACNKTFYTAKPARKLYFSERALCPTCRAKPEHYLPMTLATMRDRALRGDFAEDGGPARPEQVTHDDE